MSRENVELVRANLAEFIETHRLSDAIADDFVWDLSTFQGWPDQDEYRGREEFMRFLRGWVAPFDEWNMEVEQVEDGGGDHVVALLRQHGRLRGSDAQVDMHYGIVYTVKGGQIRRLHVYATPEEALEAVGLRP